MRSPTECQRVVASHQHDHSSVRVAQLADGRGHADGRLAAAGVRRRKELNGEIPRTSAEYREVAWQTLARSNTELLLFLRAWSVIAVLSCALIPSLAAAQQIDRPVFQVDRANPTADKPQSKLWFARGTWWTWLPNRVGSSLWRRTTSGWRREVALDDALHNLSGRADVLPDGDTVHAVLVNGLRLTFVTLHYVERIDTYRLADEPALLDVGDGEENDAIETATMARDGHGRFWIAYPWKRRMWVRATTNVDRTEWTAPFAVSDETDQDDLCAIVALPGAVGLAWSNQLDDTMNFRRHRDGADATHWEPIEEIERGDSNADDHISAVVDAQGVLLLATKNSVDRVGEPQLVLRIRNRPDGWQNLPYAPRTSTGQPSRPLILVGETPPCLLLLHTLYGPKGLPQAGEQRNTIVWQAIPLGKIEARSLAISFQPLIDPGTAVNNTTGCKAKLPKGHPWIVLSSDDQGNVYEGHLDATGIVEKTGLQSGQ